MVLTATIVASPLLAGGRPGWAVVVIGLACAATATTATLASPAAIDRSSRLLTALAGLGLVATALAALPIPVGWVASITPTTVADLHAADALLGAPPSAWWALSVSPSASRAQLVTAFAILCVVVGATRATAAGRRRDVMRAVSASGVAVALVTLAHEAVGASRVYGLVRVPMDVAPFGPLMNPNHAAGFLAMCVPAQIGTALDARGRAVRSSWIVSAALSTAVCILAISRGGILGLVVGLAVFFGLRLRARDGDGSGRALLGVGLAVAVGAGIVVIVGYEALELDVGSSTLDKLRLAVEGLDLLTERPWLGVGRGSYSEALVHLHGSVARSEYPESFPVQWLVEWGLPVGIAMLAGTASLWLGAARGALDPSRTGALAGIASIAAHELFDFATEEPGIVVVAAALFATAVSRTATAPVRSLMAPPLVLAALTAVTALVLGTRVERERVRVAEADLLVLAEGGDRAAFAARLREAASIHPAEPSITLVAAYEAARAEDGDAMAWLNRTMALAPGWAAPHGLAARVLARRGAFAQAWLELREVERRVPGLGILEGCELLVAAPDADHVTRLFEHEPDGITFLDRLADSCPSAPIDVVAAIDAAIEPAGETPSTGARLRRARRLLPHDPDGALALLEPLDGTNVRTALARAEALSAATRHPEAIAALRAARITSDGERGAVLEALARALAADGDEEGMRETLATLRGAAGSDRARAAGALVLLGSLERQLGNLGRATQAFEEANRIDPSSAGLAMVASVAEELGDLRRAYQARAELCRRSAGRGDDCTAAARLRAGGAH